MEVVAPAEPPAVAGAEPLEPEPPAGTDAAAPAVEAPDGERTSHAATPIATSPTAVARARHACHAPARVTPLFTNRSSSSTGEVGATSHDLARPAPGLVRTASATCAGRSSRSCRLRRGRGARRPVRRTGTTVTTRRRRRPARRIPGRPARRIPGRPVRRTGTTVTTRRRRRPARPAQCVRPEWSHAGQGRTGGDEDEGRRRERQQQATSPPAVPPATRDRSGAVVAGYGDVLSHGRQFPSLSDSTRSLPPASTAPTRAGFLCVCLRRDEPPERPTACGYDPCVAAEHAA
jgi:hypothetical protein